MNNTIKSSTHTAERVKKGLAKRYRTEALFKGVGLISIAFGILALSLLLFKIVTAGLSGFQQTHIQLAIHFDADTLGITQIDDPQQIASADYEAIIKDALQQQFPDVTDRRAKRDLYKLISIGASYDLRDLLIAHPDWLGQTQTLWLLADDDVDTYYKSLKKGTDYTARTSQIRQAQIKTLMDQHTIDTHFNTRLFTAGDSSEPELAGIRGAVMGSLLTLLVTLSLSFPIGVAAAIYLEEYAPKNRFTDLIEVNVSNLAAVPSVIFGLLGLAVYINLFGLPRSVPLVGGLVLTLLTLPTIIISSRNAIKSVPPSIRQAAMGLGASNMQVILHHVLPLAMPGMLTGAILGMAHALGETAPLLMIGMVAFIMDVPHTLTDPATVLPVQIYLWSDSPERAFVERTSAAIMVLLMFLICMNLIAVGLRKRLERRW